MIRTLLLLKDIVKIAVYLSFAALFLLVAILVAFVADLINKIFFTSEVKPHEKSVFITGCDTGFGNAFAKRLDSKGFRVFATCLFPTGTGATELRKSCSNRLHVLHMDVTKDESVQMAFEYVNENLGSSELWAIVNNAGILKGCSVEFSFLNDFKDCIDVNFLGYVRVIKAFLPLLKRSKGRIVNITSIGGEFPAPFYTPYTASKYAVVGFTDCLRLELDMLGISVVSIEPEMFLTGMTCPDTILKNMDTKLDSCKTSLEDDYGDDLIASFREVINLLIPLICPKISIVVDDLESAVCLESPSHTYKPRRHLLSRFLFFSYKVMPKSAQLLLMKLAVFAFFLNIKRSRIS